MKQREHRLLALSRAGVNIFGKAENEMITSVEGIYRHGKIELENPPLSVPDETPVIVTFLRSGDADLAAHGIDRRQAAELRARLAAFAEEWESPEMTAYDDYDASKSKL